MGLPKTGTTFLQNYVFSTFDQVADFGKTPSYQVERPHVHQALGMIASLPDTEFKAQSPDVKTLLVREVERAIASNPASSCQLLSYEGFFHPNSIHPLEIHTRLESIFGRFKILLTIRHPFEWIESFYLYRFYRFLNGGAPSFEVWAKRARKRAWNPFVCCDYWPVIERLIERAGRGCVLVEPMEGLIQTADASARARLARFLVVDAGALAGQFDRAEPTKQRIDELGFLLGRTLYESQGANLTEHEQLLLKRLFRKVHAQLKDDYKKARIPHDVVERCFSDTERTAIRDGNTALSKFLGQDLGRFGYPVREM
jgi:hypothetical protein